MLFTINGGHSQTTGAVVSLRCPGCRQQGTFEALGNIPDMSFGPKHMVFGQRRCPNDKCRTHVFFALESGKLMVSYPAERLDFDASGVPRSVSAALEEAITCHATQCFTAAAIMVRKTLEELCHDQDAKGSNLKERITALGKKVLIPQDLVEGMDHLRLLGNDAAHIESQNFAKVGEEEVQVGIMFAKEVLKAVYQYAGLVGRMKALQKPPSGGA